jgi:predicted alpha/beta superfamily hydrolase
MPTLKHEQFPREMIVYLPPMYEAEGERRFPVLYMQDGQNLFDPETSFIPGKYWRMGETADELIEAGAIEPLILVGIYNAGVGRIEEYTPGGADAYGRMLVEELKPFIDAQYRTLPERCGMGGASLGGLVTLYLGLRYATLFSRLAVMSPSVWWGRRMILRVVAALKTKPALRIWLDVGTNEAKRSVPDARALRDGLIKKGWRPDGDLAYLEAAGGAHTESAWAERVAPMLRFLYPAAAGKHA